MKWIDFEGRQRDENEAEEEEEEAMITANNSIRRAVPCRNVDECNACKVNSRQKIPPAAHEINPSHLYVSHVAHIDLMPPSNSPTGSKQFKNSIALKTIKCFKTHKF